MNISSDKTAEDIPAMVRTWLQFGNSQAGIAMKKYCGSVGESSVLYTNRLQVGSLVG